MSQYDTLEQKAVALKYDETQNSAPVIVASGMGYVAEKIVEIANDNGIPVYEDNSLATVLAQMKLGDPAGIVPDDRGHLCLFFKICSETCG